jgi:tripartite ATP-independent transporter DctP family solute receptor
VGVYYKSKGGFIVKRILVLGVVMVLTLGLLVSSAAAATYTLRFNHVLGPNHPYHKGLQTWADRVAERTNGDLQILVFHSSQLGVEEDILEQARQGVPVGQNTDSARLGNYVPGIAVMNAPYFVTSIEEVVALNDLELVQEWKQELADKYGFQILSFNWVQGFRHFMTNKPISKPEDLKGLRIRTAPAPIWQESVRALGATPVAMNFGEMYSAIQQGALDGAELVYDNIADQSLHEVLKYVNETGHFLLINFQIVSASWFNQLPEEYQKILVEECDRAGLETSYFIQENTEKVKAEAQAKGMIIHTDIDLEAFKAAGQAAYDKMNLTEVNEQIKEALAQ